MIKRVVRGGSQDAAQQSPESRMCGGALPKHSQQERAEERRIEKREEELEIIHQVVESQNNESGPDAHDNRKHRGQAAHGEIVMVMLCRG